MTKMKQHLLYSMLFLLISAFICLTFCQSPISPYYTDDSSVYQYIGKQILEGKMPYRDIFDHKGPLIYLWHALGQFIHPLTGQYYLETIILFLALLFAFKLTNQHLKNNFLSFLIVILVFSTTPHIDTIGNTENLSLIPIFYILYFYQTLQKKQKLPIKDYFLFGFTCQFLLLIKANYLIIPFCLTLQLLFYLIKNKKYQTLQNFIIFAFLGALNLSIIVISWLYINDALLPFYKDYFLFNLEYSTLHTKQQLIIETFNTFIKLPGIIISFILILLLLINLKKYSKNQKNIIITLITTYLLTFISLITTGNPVTHYVFILYPITIILSAYLFMLIPNTSKKIPYCSLSIKNSINILLIIASLISTTYTIKKSKHYKSIQYSNDINAKLASTFLKNNLAPNEKFLYLGPDFCIMHLYTNHHSFSRYAFNYVVNKLNPEQIKNEIEKYHYPTIIINIYDTTGYSHLNFENYYLIYSNDRYLIISNK